MRWWQMRKRDADLTRELQSDLELEGKSSGNAACHQKRPAARPCGLSAIPLLFASTRALCGVGTGWRIFFEIYGSASVLYCGRLAFP